MFSVVIRERGGQAQVRTFDKAEVSLGRIQGNDIVLPKGNISKRHARIVHRDDDFVVVDLRSTNGTYVNGHKVSSPMVVSEDDKLYVGDFVLQVRRGEIDLASIDEGDLGEAPGETAATIAAAPSTPATTPSRPAEPASFGLDADEDIHIEIEEEEPAASVGVSGFDETIDAPDLAERGSLADDFDVDMGDEQSRIGTAAQLPAARPAPAAAGTSEQYVDTLALLYDRAKQSIFAGRDLDHVDFEHQWHELERAVFNLVERARVAGEIGPAVDSASLTTDLLYEFTALGPVEHLLADESASDIFVDAFDRISVRRAGELVLEPNRAFSSATSFEAVVHRLIRTRSTAPEGSHVHVGRLEDGTWFHITLAPVAVDGPLLHLAKPAPEVEPLDEWTSEGRASAAVVETLRLTLQDRGANIAIASRFPEAAASLASAILRELAPSERLALLECHPGLVVPATAHAVRFNADSVDAVQAAANAGANRIVAIGVEAATLGELLYVGATQRGGLLLSIRARAADDLAMRLRAVQDPAVPKETALGIAAAALDYAVFVGLDRSNRPVIEGAYEIRADSLTGLAMHPVGQGR